MLRKATQMVSNNHELFFKLLQAGLWGSADKDLRVDRTTDWEEVGRIAEEQSVLGLVLAGVEHFKVQDSSFKIPQELLLQWIGDVQMIELQNKEMNLYVGELIELLRKEDICAILVKGQGIAQCYERPLWRSCGDIDLLLNKEDYEAAKILLIPKAISIDEEQIKKKHIALTINNWIVELHGTLRTNLWESMERLMDSIQTSAFYGGNVRTWLNGKTQVSLLREDEDVVFVFAHILQHFFIEGIGLRQICDWCRLLDTYKDKIDRDLLEKRLRSARLMSKWKAFAAFAVEYLGMPEDAMPFYDPSYCWKRKAKGVLELVMDSGNFGQGKDKSYKEKYSKGVRYMISFCRHFKDGYRRFKLFPAEALLMWWKLMMHGLQGILGIGAKGSGL